MIDFPVDLFLGVVRLCDSSAGRTYFRTLSGLFLRLHFRTLFGAFEVWLISASISFLFGHQIALFAITCWQLPVLVLGCWQK